MKIVVIGGSGLIGSKLVSLLRTRGHQVVAASPDTGVNTLTGEGLAAALAGAQVVVDGLVEAGADGDAIRIAPAFVQPIAADDVAVALADLAVRQPVNRTIEVAGPDLYRLGALAREVLAADEDQRLVIADVHARYFGAELNDRSLTPDAHSRRRISKNGCGTQGLRCRSSGPLFSCA
ncbi:MAG TPA: hypothetical protein VKB16_23940 [Beijerinckiaceae bacterium]|nr:hypothetical protein [Beijerinckiaceae bacterium]